MTVDNNKAFQTQIECTVMIQLLYQLWDLKYNEFNTVLPKRQKKKWNSS